MKVTINRYLVIFLAVAAGFLLGWWIFSSGEGHSHASNGDSTDQVWTCSMHPQVRRDEPGDCPICGMDLIPVDEQKQDGSVIGPEAIQMTATARKLAHVRTSEVKKERPLREVYLQGKVSEIPGAVFTQPVHYSGRVEKLMVTFVGEYVRKGQRLASIYSPKLVNTQKELLEAFEIKDSHPELLSAAKEKLRNLKITDSQINEIIKQGEVTREFPVIAGYSGYVTNKRINEGDYVEQGASIMEITRLGQVWGLFDVYENHFPFVHVGDSVKITGKAWPGQEWQAVISYLDPVVNPISRTRTARVELSNAAGKLLPGMFLTGEVSGAVDGNLHLTVPESAVLWTGSRSVVYLVRETDQGVYYQLRQVELGPLAGDSYIIESGLEEGEVVVTQGTFSVDAAAQLAGKPSMMNYQATPEIELNREALGNVRQIFDQYLKLKDLLVESSLNAAKNQALELQSAVQGLETSQWNSTAADIWQKNTKGLEQLISKMASSDDLNQLRENFRLTSNQLIELAQIFDPYAEPLFVQHCPMANNNEGADWLSLESKIRNPYYGDAMLTCGSVTSKIE